MKMNVSNIKKNVSLGLFGALGLVAGSAAMRFAAGMLPGWSVPIIGLALGTAVTAKGTGHAKAVGVGILMAGTIDGVKRLTSGRTGFLETINNAFPTLSGMRGMRGIGANYIPNNDTPVHLLNGGTAQSLLSGGTAQSMLSGPGGSAAYLLK